MNRNDRSIVGLVMVAHAMVHTYELSIPILVTVWLAEFDVISLFSVQVPVTPATIGYVVTAGYALFGVGALPGGIVADRVGSRKLILACLAGMAAAFLGLGAAPGVAVVALALVVWGAAASVYHPAGLALISKGVSERGTAFAYHGMAGNVGIALGPLATTLLLLVLDWRVVVGILAVPALAAALVATRVEFDEQAAVRADGGDRSTDDPAAGNGDDGDDDDGDARAAAGVESLGEFLTASRTLFLGGFALVFAVVMLSGLYYRGVLTFLPHLLGGIEGFEPVEVAGRSLQPARYFYSGLLMVGVLGQYVGGKLTDRIPTEAGIAAAYGALGALALLFLPVADAGIPALLVFGAALGFVLFMVQPLYQATIAEYTPPGVRGLSYGFTYLGVFGVGALGGALAGGLLSYFSPLALFAVLAAFGFGAGAIGAALYAFDLRPTR